MWTLSNLHKDSGLRTCTFSWAFFTEALKLKQIGKHFQWLLGWKCNTYTWVNWPISIHTVYMQCMQWVHVYGRVHKQWTIHTVYTQCMQWMLVGSGRVYKQWTYSNHKHRRSLHRTTFHGSLHFLPSAIDRSWGARGTFRSLLSGFHTGFFFRGGTFVCGKVDQLRES